jgi:AraC family transcriptional regulator of adaptative response / DNA-3-methyladenine glycosylase II
LAQTHRLLLAKRLLADTSLPVTQVAYASGFQSLRRFNTAFRDAYRLPPSGVPRPTASRRVIRARPDVEPLGAMLRLTLAYRPPFAWDTLLDWLGWDALRGVEAVTGRRYARTVLVEGRSGIVQAEDASGATLDSAGDREAAPVMRNHVRVEISQSLVPVLMPLLSRLRQLFDLDAEPAVVDAHLAAGGLSGMIKRRPGLRIPGAIDGFDVALRILLRGWAWVPPPPPRDPDLAGRVVWALGEPIETGRPDLSRLAPNAERVAEAGSDRLVGLGVPRHRAEAAIALARLVADNRLRLELGGDPGMAREQLADATGADDRSLSAIMLRTLGWPDAFPVLDPALQRAAGVLGVPALQARAEQWRPWRGYAALHLWLHHNETRKAAALNGVVAANGARDL